MKTEDIKKQLMNVLEEVKRLQEKSELDMATAEFLNNEGEKLLIKKEDPALTFEQKELLAKQANAIRIRIEREIRCIEDGASQLLVLEKKLDYLKQLIETESVEE